MAVIRVAFWNLQNLFDTTASPLAADFEFTPANGWTQAVFNAKVQNLASVIKLMHGGQLPHILGMCEIENRDVVQTLVDRLAPNDYAIAHIESPDIRGIGTSLVYSTGVFDVDGLPVGHNVHMRYPTRDIFEVPLKLKSSGKKLRVFVNHWPSRSQGQRETEPLRQAVASRCGELVDMALKIEKKAFLALPETDASLQLLQSCWNENLLLMGDFNDEPFNSSVIDFLRAANDTDHLEEVIKKPKGSALPAAATYLGKEAPLYNCMWNLLGNTDTGTFYSSQSPKTMNLLDQFIVSRGLYFGSSGLKMRQEMIEIFKPALMCTGKNRPKKFEFDKSGIKVNGFSDHFPIQATIEIL